MANPLAPALAALQLGDLDRAAQIAGHETRREPANVSAWELLSVAEYRRANAPAAIEAASRAVALQPINPALKANLGAMLRAAGRLDEAEAAYREAIATGPTLISARQNLGNLLLDQDRLAEAEQTLREAVRIAPAQADPARGLAAVLQRQGRLEEAAAEFERLLALAPGDAQALSDLGCCLMGLERHGPAQAAFDHAIALAPNLASAHGNLGALNLRAGRLHAAMEATRRAHEISPDEHRWISNLAVIAKDLGRFDESAALFHQALALRPDYASGHSNLLFCLNYHPTMSAEAIFEEYRRWDQAHAVGKAPAEPQWLVSRDPNRRLRVGFVSPDFREHAARHFIEPFLSGLDRSDVEIVCYAELANADGTSERLKAMADQWRLTAGLSDEAVAEMIRQDKVDILVDLGGHTASSRLPVFAYRPAPIQVAHMLGHGYTSGLSAIDVFLSDDQLSPQGSDHLFSEKLVRLDRIPLAYQPPEGMPEVVPTPGLAKGHVTFGYFGRPERVNEQVIAVWSAILEQVPSSRLMLNAKALAEPAFKALMEQKFAAHGVGPERLELVYTTPQPTTWAAYGQVDIALDPFPHNAGTTTIEALYLGVPVLSLKDRPSVGRFGASILGAVGLGDWATDDTDAYIAKAVAEAADLPALDALRQGLRHRFNTSPLADADGLGRELAQTFRTLWKDWCGEGKAEQAKALAIDSDTLRLQGKLPEAEVAARQALAIDPACAAAANHLGNALVAQGRLLEAEAAYAQALDLDPGNAEAFNNRALSLMKRGMVCAAEQDLRRAMALRPELPEIGFNLASALQDQGRLKEALAEYRQAAEQRPDHAVGHGAVLFCLNYQTHLPAEDIFAEFRRWDARHAAPHTPASPNHKNNPDPERRLRIGYVSPDFGTRSARHFIEPMLTGHDRRQVEVVCYAETPNPDAFTDRFKAMADEWRSTVGLDDDQMAALIAQDRIDVLIDLGGHTARNRLRALSRKPAPVQVAHFLGHGYTSGLSAMDAFLADQHLAPPGSEGLFTEAVRRMDRIPIAYLPPEGLPEVAPLPALRKGYVTFGHFGRTVRINDEVVQVWAAILKAVPDSRLMLNTAPFADPGVRQRYADLFAAEGVEADRLEMVFTTPQPTTWAAYGEVDIALDPFPHNAGVTTIEALWLGVPVVSLADRPSVGRFGKSILEAAGLGDWVTTSRKDYIARAVAAASDIEGLVNLRAGLRARMGASPLADGAGLSRALEAEYRALWQGWCATQAFDPTAVLQDAAAAYGEGRYDEATTLFRKLTDRFDDAGSWSNLGATLKAQGRTDEAEAAYRNAIARDPSLANAHANLGNLLTGRRQFDDAEAAYRRALEISPDQAEVWRSLALCLMGAQRAAEAKAAIEQALALAPDDAAAHETLASLLRQAGRPVEAETHYRRATELAPNDPRMLSNMAVALEDLGRFDESAALFHQALALRPDYASGHSNLLFCLNYHPTMSAEAIFEEYRRWDQAHAVGKAPAEPQWLVSRDPNRRLRVGFVSPDFREHAARHFIEPFLSGLDRSDVEIVCYAELANADGTSERLKAMADQWRLTAGLSDEAVAEMIRQDKVDILVDLGGHTASSRLPVFAYRPAPIQVAHMLGHGYTSGLSAIDVFLSDDQLSPQGSDHLFSEKLVRLDRIPLAYQPPEGMPEVVPTPGLAKGHVTFGYFGRPERVNEQVIAVWSAILEQVPSSRLMLNAKALAEPAFKALMEQKFAAHGVGPERLELVYTTPQPTTWAAYGQVDIALDPFPHNAGTTTIEALYLGVPVLSLKDRPSVGRFGASILGAVGLGDWATDDTDAYIAKAVAEAADLPALDALRQGLRHRFNTSPLADADGLGRELAATFRTLWKDWCGEGKADPPLADDLGHQAIAAFSAGDPTGAATLADKALAANSDHFDALHVRGVVRFKQGRLNDAAQDVAAAIALNPERPEPRWNLTAILRAKGDLTDAEAQGLAAIRAGPAFAEAHNNLGSVYQDLARAGEAEACFREAIRLRPDYAEAWSNLAWTLNARGLGVESETAARRAIAIRPGDANAFNNLGSALMQLDRLDEAGDAFRQAVALKPDFAMAHSNLLFCLNYSPTLSGEAIFAEYRRWNDLHARGLARPRAFAFDPDPARRLRVGYVSPDFRNHAVSYFVEPMLAAHDRSRVELFCYSETRNPDAVTERFKALADHWRSTVGLSDDAMAAMILEDRIDVLADLAGHTALNRLSVFARRVAPVQVAHMVGSGSTTGLDEMDAFLSDAALTPAGAEAIFSEQIIRLPRMPLTYAPPAGMPEPSPSPASAKGYVTFGCFSRTARINDRVLDAWADILRRVPTARLTLNAKPFQEKSMRKAFRAHFAERGVKAGRLDLVYTTPQPTTWAAYGDIDIALDPFPHNAGTTTFEALWLGVPVVSLADRAPVGRFGKSILGAASLGDWATDDVKAYVDKAVKAARDIPTLARLRAGLRDRIEQSPLRDPTGLARALENAYRDLYRARADRR